MTPLRGVLAPALTPFDEQLRPDVGRFLGHCRWLLAQGCRALAVFGTTSEANSLSVDEKERLLDGLLEAGIPGDALLPGTGGCALPDTVRLTRKAVEAGCAGVLVLPPFYYKGVSEEGLYRSYSEVIERVGDARLRLFLYHIPQFTLVPIADGVIERLLKKYPSAVAGMKDSSGDWQHTQATRARFPELQMFVGSEKFLLANLREGGPGCITASANVNAKAIARLFHEWREPHAEKLQQELEAARVLLEKFPMIPALKAVLARGTGHEGWRRVRPPLVELSETPQWDLSAQDWPASA